MTMGLEKEELIERLTTVSTLYRNKLEIEAEMEEFVPEDHYERKIVLPPFPGEYKSNAERDAWARKIVHTADNAIEKMEAAYGRAYAPKKPVEPRISPFEEPAESKEEKDQLYNYGCMATASAVIGGIFTLSVLATLGNGFSFVPFAIAAIGIGVFVFARNKKKKIKEEQQRRSSTALDNYNQKKTEALADYKSKMQAYEADNETYKANLQKFMENYIPWRELYLQQAEEENRIAEMLEEDRKVGIQKLFDEKYLPAQCKLEEYNDVLSDEYLPAVNVIINLLKNDRAGDLREAINLYEEIVYRERQLEFEREKEAQRQFEEQQRRDDEERRYREEMRFRENQERQRQREEEQRQKDEERRHREDMQQRERQERERQYEEHRRMEEDRRRADKAAAERRHEEDAATRRQCNTCALASRCSVAFTRPNCASFRPR